MNKIFESDSLQVLKSLADKSVHCCITSPPYFGLRDYGVEGQIGLEESPEKYVDSPQPFSEAHFATFPPDLIVDMVKAGSPENGIVLDPFMGAGTTALVAAKLNRQFIGIELNPEYIKISERRLANELGFFNPLKK